MESLKIPPTSIAISNQKTTSDTIPSHLPSSEYISNRFIARELQEGKCLDRREDKRKIDDMKRMIHVGICQRNMASSSSFFPLSQQIGYIKEKLSFLHRKVDSMASIPLLRNSARSSITLTPVLLCLTINTLNCWGMCSPIPYVLHLIEYGSDIIALEEHWLWPYNIDARSNIYQIMNIVMKSWRSPVL